MGSDDAGKVRIGSAVHEQVCETVGAVLDRLTRIRGQRDMHDGELAVMVSGGDGGSRALTAERGHGVPDRGAVFDDDLDVVRPFGNPRGDEGLDLAWAAHRGRSRAATAAVAPRRRHSSPGKAQVSDAVFPSCGPAESARDLRIITHVQHGGGAEQESLLELRDFSDVYVAVDEPRQQRLARSVQARGVVGHEHVLGDLEHSAASNGHGSPREHAFAVEHPSVLDIESFRAVTAAREGRPARARRDTGDGEGNRPIGMSDADARPERPRCIHCSSANLDQETPGGAHIERVSMLTLRRRNIDPVGDHAAVDGVYFRFAVEKES